MNVKVSPALLTTLRNISAPIYTADIYSEVGNLSEPINESGHTVITHLREKNLVVPFLVFGLLANHADPDKQSNGNLITCFLLNQLLDDAGEFTIERWNALTPAWQGYIFRAALTEKHQLFIMLATVRPEVVINRLTETLAKQEPSIIAYEARLVADKARGLRDAAGFTIEPADPVNN